MARTEVHAFLEYHQCQNVEGFQYGLITQLIEADPVLWLIKYAVLGEYELVAVPQPLEIVVLENDQFQSHSHDSTMLSTEPGETRVRFIHNATRLQLTYRPSLAPVHHRDGTKKVLIGGLEIYLDEFRESRRARIPCVLDIRSGLVDSNEDTVKSHLFMSLRGISPLADAILSQRPFENAELYAEMEILLGENRQEAWELILRWREMAKYHLTYHFKLWLKAVDKLSLPVR